MLSNVQPLNCLVTFCGKKKGKGIDKETFIPRYRPHNDNPRVLTNAPTEPAKVSRLNSVRKLARAYASKDRRIYRGALRELLKRQKDLVPPGNVPKRAPKKSPRVKLVKQLPKLRKAFDDMINLLLLEHDVKVKSAKILYKYPIALEAKVRMLERALKKAERAAAKRVKR